MPAAHRGEFVLTPDEFGSPEAVPFAMLVAESNVELGDMKLPPTETDVIRERDAETNRTSNAT